MKKQAEKELKMDLTSTSIDDTELVQSGSITPKTRLHSKLIKVASENIYGKLLQQLQKYRDHLVSLKGIEETKSFSQFGEEQNNLRESLNKRIEIIKFYGKVNDHVLSESLHIRMTEYAPPEHGEVNNIQVFEYGFCEEDLFSHAKKFNEELRGVLKELSSKDSAVSSNSGRNSKKSKGKGADTSVTNKILHPLESIIINQAINKLQDSDVSVVLTNIFARDNDGKIKIDKDQTETHTILLYKSVNNLLIIDPSNSSFSSHLACAVNQDILRIFGQENSFQLVAPNKTIQIYSHEGETGRAWDQARDCVDIAVKLAFEILVHSDKVPKFHELDGWKLNEWQPIINISNDKDIDPTVRGKKDTSRTKQSSCQIVRTKYQEKMKKLDLMIKILALASEEEKMPKLLEILEEKTIVKSEGDDTEKAKEELDHIDKIMKALGPKLFTQLKQCFPGLSDVENIVEIAEIPDINKEVEPIGRNEELTEPE